MSAPRRPGPLRRVQGERPALGPRREGGGGRRPPEARDGRDRQRATSWQTPRPSPTRWPTAASGATPTPGPSRATRRPTTRGRAPGARANTAPDLRPDAGGMGTVRHDHGHGRLGTLSLLASANRRPARRPPRKRDARRPRPRRIPGRQAPEGRPDAGRVWRRLGAPPREGETPPAVRPGPPRARVRARVRPPAGPGRGLPLGDGPPDTLRHPGLEQGRARGRVLRHLGRRAPSRSSTGGGGTCRTQARRPRDPSWTPSFRMGQTRQASC